MTDHREMRLAAYHQEAVRRVVHHGETPRAAAEAAVMDSHSHLVEDVTALTERSTVKMLKRLCNEVSGRE
jgi:hypothetical protein